MSLGTWFRDYVYIPMGGNRVSPLRQIFNIFVVWMLTGMWHGASWNFIIWGLYFAVLLIIEKNFLLKHLKKTKVIKHIYVFIFVSISFIIFNAVDMKQAGYDLRGMFGFAGLPVLSSETVYYLRAYAVTLAISVIAATPFVTDLVRRAREKDLYNKVFNILEVVVIPLVLVICTAYLVDGSFNPFLYFRF